MDLELPDEMPALPSPEGKPPLSRSHGLPSFWTLLLCLEELRQLEFCPSPLTES